MLKQHRKALASAAGTTVCSYVAAWAQTNGVLPGWLTAIECVLLGVVVGIIVAGTRDERRVPDAVARLRALAEARRAGRP